MRINVHTAADFPGPHAVSVAGTVQMSIIAPAMGRVVIGTGLVILLVGCWGRARPTYEYEPPVTTTSTDAPPVGQPTAAGAPPAEGDPAAAPTTTVPPRASVWRRGGKW